jgi:hypothetical protein
MSHQFGRDVLVAWARDRAATIPHMAAIAAMLESDGQAKAVEPSCVHIEEPLGEYWRSSCGHDLVWEDGPPSEHGCIYCGHCGKPIVEKPFMEPGEEDGDQEAAG